MRLLAAVLLIVVLALLIVPWLLGVTAPAEHVARAERNVALPPAAVLDLLSDLDGWPRWRRGVDSAREVTGEVLLEGPAGGLFLRLGAGERSGGAAGAAGELVVHYAATGGGFSGTWTFTVTPSGRGSAVRLRDDGVVRQPSRRFAHHYLLGYTAPLDALLADLASAEPPPR
ncbi:MAG: SRPBCC family protein [Acidobacteria bacterium]|nr:MAG: SRPBCC family protein [Acidobacteriota bacterium]REK07945.1 MAG: SRPBCC family protein [Acidobacteriota bacterium]